jgi:CsoR family transcriptional regulator, copper-sensing transcriptional repressor
MSEKPLGEAEVEEPVSEADRTHNHEHYHSVVNRLARIEGHVRAVKRMVEEEVPCPDILVQIAAVRSALGGVGRLILEDHLKSCMVTAVQQGNFEQAFADLQSSLKQFIE